MADVNQHNPEERGELTEVDRLLSLLVDGEATEGDRAQFEQRAAGDPELWRRRADAQETAAALERDVLAELGGALDMELDIVQVPAAAPARSLRGPWIAAVVGWAAVLVLAVLWFVDPGGLSDSGGAQPIDVPAGKPVMTYDDALQTYLNAPFVRGQMQPRLLQVEELPDGTKRYWILRRIEESLDLPAEVQLPVDESDNLTVEPASLRESEPIGTPQRDS